MNRLESVLQRGICSSLTLQELGQEHQTGFDDGTNSVVYVNCVKTAEKLEKALFDPYDGLYSISLEMKNDKGANLDALSDRAHQVAVLILKDIDLDEVDERALESGGGFYFFERKNIEPEKIMTVIMSEKLKDLYKANVNFEFVKSCQQKNISYSYKQSFFGGYQTVRRQIAIDAPDYLPKLIEIYNTHFAPFKKKMFIHVVRL